MSIQKVQYLVNDQGVFSGSKQYAVQQVPVIAGILTYFCPSVIFGGVRYIAENISVQPTLGVNPNADAAWGIFNESYVPTVAPVLVASTANLTLSGEQTIDGVLTSTNRVLVKNQTLSKNNGIYVTAAGAWTRSTDADSWAELVGLVVQVEQGTVGAGFIFACDVATGGTLGTTAITFTNVGRDQTITGTYPISVNNNVVSVTHCNGFIKGVAGSAVGAGALTINGGTNVVTSNLTVNATSVSIPLNSSLVVTAVIDVTTASASGATFTLTGTNCTCTTQAIAVGASVTNQYVTLCAYVTSTSTSSPAISVVLSSLTGTVDIVNDSFIQISQS